MSFGFRALNDFGEVVVDETSPVYAISSVGTLSGATTSFNSPTFGPLFSYTIPPNDELIFFRLPSVGNMVYRAPSNLAGQNGWLSNLQNLQFFRARRVSAFSGTPSGFGMVIRDASGNITYRADQDTAAINEGIELPFTTQTFSSSFEWYCIPNAYGGLFEIRNGVLFFGGTGVYRITANTIRSVDDDFPNFPPFLVLTANG